jgi:hypothetical protein
MSAADPARRTPRRARLASVTLATAVFGLMPALLVVYDGLYHEFWRDEVQAYLEARYAPFPDFFAVMHLEGVPFLFHLLLKLYGTFLPPLATMLVVGWMGYETLLFGTYRLLRSICGDPVRSLVITLLLSLTYNYVYELGVVVRQYGMSMGLALVTLALLRDALRTGRRALVVPAAVACALGASSSPHGACVCGGALVAYTVIALLRGQLDLRSVLILAGTVPFFALTAYLAMPFAERCASVEPPMLQAPSEFSLFARQALAGSVTPQDWWVAASFGEEHFINRLGVLRGWSPSWLAAGAVLALASRSRRLLNPRELEFFDVIAIVVGWAPLLEIIVEHFWGSPRHHLFLSIPGVVVVLGWMARSPWRRWLWVAAAPFFAFELVLAARDLKMDHDLPFSDSKAVAARLAPDAHVVADSFMAHSGLLFWRPDAVLRGADQAGRRARFTRPDQEWATRVAIQPLVADECRQTPDRVFYVGTEAGSMSSCLKLVMRGTPYFEQLWTGEHPFDLWQVDCTCIARSP